jgi:heme-degrading monooxygenase HmoA
MFVQIISLTAPLNHIAQLRELVSNEYLPALRNRPGFVAAHLLEQVDDPDSAQLIVYWDDQRSVEDAVKTGVLAGSTQSIAARMPGLRIQRQSYVVRVAVSDRKAQHVVV